MRFGNMMARKTLLFLGADHCRACSWQNGELSAAEYFSDDAGDREQFAAFLQTHRDTALLLTDLVEEDFRHETVPHLRGAERAALIRRKLEQYYRNTPFRQAVTLRRRKDGRRDDDMLFCALTNPALVSPWLNIMLAHGIALSGIHSIPNISAPLVKDIPSSRLLLLSWEKNAGLRQTYFDAGLLRFSRLTPLPDSNSFGASAATEAARTQHYLKSLSLLPQSQALEAHIICHADDRSELETHLNKNADMRYSYLDIRELARRIGLKTPCADSDATPLFLHLLAAHPPRSHYATAEHTRFLRLAHVRRALSGLNAALAAGCLLWVAPNLMAGMALQEESLTLKMQAEKLSQQTRQIIQGFPRTLASATDMKNAVMLSRKLDGLSPPPQTILAGLAKTLDDFPLIRTAKLSWQTGASSAAPVQIILLDGELAKFSGNYRAAPDYLERFRQTLTRRGYAVTAPSLSPDISPQGRIAAGADADRPLQFSLKISWGTAI